MAAELKTPSCKGSGRTRGCDGSSPFTYKYDYPWPVTTTAKFSPREVMDVFKQNPQEIYPFEVAGCDSFSNGAECSLKTGVGVNPNGKVGVTTTATSVTFTVLERGYFDAPGSTIKFSTYADAQGVVYLRQEADAYGVDGYMAFGINVMHAARGTWQQQQQNLIGVLDDVD